MHLGYLLLLFSFFIFIFFLFWQQKDICALDSDDYMHEERIALQAKACETHPDCIIGSNFERYITKILKNINMIGGRGEGIKRVVGS